MYKRGRLLALFLFLQVKTVGNKIRFVDYHTQYGMETLQDHSFFCAQQRANQGCLHP